MDIDWTDGGTLETRERNLFVVHAMHDPYGVLLNRSSLESRVILELKATKHTFDHCEMQSNIVISYCILITCYLSMEVSCAVLWLLSQYRGIHVLFSLVSCHVNYLSQISRQHK